MKVKDVQHGKTTRKSFARIEEILEMPNLIEVQKKSYEWFLDQGLREVFDDTASITDYTGNLELSFLDFSMDEEPKYSIEECKARDATYATPLKVRMRLRNKETGEIKVNGVLWTAKCTTGERVEAGGHVTIERVEGAKLYVRPAKCPCTKA